MSDQEPVVELHPDVARTKTRAFFHRHNKKLTALALTGLGVGSFMLGRRSKDVVDSVEIDVNRADDTSTD